jgi:hypothetical protein
MQITPRQLVEELPAWIPRSKAAELLGVCIKMVKRRERRQLIQSDRVAHNLVMVRTADLFQFVTQ